MVSEVIKVTVTYIWGQAIILFSQDFWLEQQLRLSTILQAKPCYPSVPLLVICDCDLATVKTHLQLERFTVSGLVSAFDVVCIEEDVLQMSASEKVGLAQIVLLRNVEIIYTMEPHFKTTLKVRPPSRK